MRLVSLPRGCLIGNDTILRIAKAALGGNVVDCHNPTRIGGALGIWKTPAKKRSGALFQIYLQLRRKPLLHFFNHPESRFADRRSDVPEASPRPDSRLHRPRFHPMCCTAGHG
jgi:hypothetical protein